MRIPTAPGLRFALVIPAILLYLAGMADAQLACHQCHGTDAPPDSRPLDATTRDTTTGGFRGNHRHHVTTATTQASCSTCHVGSSDYTSSHRNGLIKLAANINNSPLAALYKNITSAFPQTATPDLGTCTNVNCHFERETPTWGSARLSAPDGCGTCHGAPPAGGDSGAAGSHATHDGYYAGAARCGQCHHDHLTGEPPFSHATSAGRRPLGITLHNPDGSVGGTYWGPLTDYLPKSQNNQFGRCSNLYCHSNGVSVATGVPFQSISSPIWGANGTLACSGCHGYPPGFRKETAPKANSHGRHNFYGFSCSRCHYGTTTDGATISDKTKHVNMSYDISAPPGETLTYTFSPSGGSCTDTYCHSTAQGTGDPTGPPEYRPASWGMYFANGCGFCHSAGWHEWIIPAVGSGSHARHMRFETGRACNICHYNPRYVVNGETYVCDQCHATFYGHRDESARGHEHVNGSIDVALDPNFPAPGAGGIYTGDSIPRTPYGSCEAFYCHSQGTRQTPPFDAPFVQPVRWGGPSMPADCTGCHGGDQASSHVLATGSHPRHLRYDCIRCHAATVTGNRSAIPFRSGDGVSEYIYTRQRLSKNANGLIEVAFDNRSAALGGGYAGLATPAAKAPGSSPGRCINTYCHGNGVVVATGVPFGNVSSPVWGNNETPGCDRCHGYPPDYPDRSPKANSHQGSHAAYGCNICHYETTADGAAITNQARHINYRYDLAGAPGATFTYTYAGTGSSCTSVSCHANNTSARAWTATTCGICHNSPPDTPSHRRHFTGATLQASYGNTSTTRRYTFNCGTCHPLDTGRDNNGSVEVELYNPSAPTGSRKALNPPSAVYAGGGTTFQDERGISYTNGSCTDIYCHSNGTSVATGQPAASAPVTWNGPAMTCTGCHASPPDYANGSPKANGHPGSHAGRGCQFCHYGTTADGATIADITRHGNGTYDAEPAPGTTFSYSYAPTGGSCSAVSCHNDGTAIATGTRVLSAATAVWGAEMACTSCHAHPPAYANGSPKANGHQGSHAPYGCNGCHYATTTDDISIADRSKHGNGQYDVTPAPGNGFSYTFAAAGGTCANASCHGDGSAVATGIQASSGSAQWGGAALNCSGCHGNPPAYASGSPKANSHGRHMFVSCSYCHYETTTTGTTITNPAKHRNGQYEVATYPYYSQSFSYTFNPAGSTCSNVPCHSDGTAAPRYLTPTSPVVTWGGPPMTCGSCHGNPPAYANGAPKTNSHLGSHAGYGCNICHYLVTGDGVSITSSYYHIDNYYHVNPAPGTTLTYSFATTGGTCAAVSCHSDGTKVRTGTVASPTVKWGAANGCGTCHGTPPAYANQSPKRNSHAGKHGTYGCQVCHYKTTSDGTTITDATLHKNSAYDVDPAPGTGFSYSFGTFGNCSNVTCHHDGTSVATGSPRYPATAAYWGVAMQCYTCHGSPVNYPNGSPKANSHARHWYMSIGCQVCHYTVTTTGDSITTPANHMNNLYDVSPAPGKSFVYTFATSGGSCSSNSCHGDGTNIATGTLRMLAAPVWGGAARTCDSCHGNPPSYANGSPKANSHLGGHAVYGCQFCHYYVTYDGTSIGSPYYHTNGQYNVSARPSMNISYGFITTGGNCTSTACHSDGTYVATGTVNAPVTMKWGNNTVLGCTSCHASPPLYADRSPKGNLHASHTGFGCQVCHANVTTNGFTISDKSRHANGAYDVASDGSVVFNYTYRAGGSSCSDVSCHTTAPANCNWSLKAQTPKSFIPSDGIGGVAVTTAISVIFNEAMDASTITDATFRVNNGAIAGTVSYEPASMTATFTPAAPLDYYNTYSVTLSSAVRNQLGQPLHKEFTWSFTTTKSAGFATILYAPFQATGGFAVTNGFTAVSSGGSSWGLTFNYLYPATVALPYMNGPYMMVMEATKIDAELRSPLLDLTGYQSMELRFNYNFKHSNPSVADVDVSLNGADGPWTNVWRRNNFYYPGYVDMGTQTLNLSALAKGQANVMVRFRSTPQSPANTGYWAVDDVVVGGDPR